MNANAAFTGKKLEVYPLKLKSQANSHLIFLKEKITLIEISVND
jgi:hypothetical protein